MEYRGGTYCTQVEATDVMCSLDAWYKKIKKEKKDIKYLGESILSEISTMLSSEMPTTAALNSLKNIWYVHLPTKLGSIHITIVQTDISRN